MQIYIWILGKYGQSLIALHTPESFHSFTFVIGSVFGAEDIVNAVETNKMSRNKLCEDTWDLSATCGQHSTAVAQQGPWTLLPMTLFGKYPNQSQGQLSGNPGSH